LPVASVSQPALRPPRLDFLRATCRSWPGMAPRSWRPRAGSWRRRRSAWPSGWHPTLSKVDLLLRNLATGSTRWRPALPPHPRRSRREVAYVDGRLRRPRGRRQALAPLVSISTYLVLIAVTRSQAICWPLVALRLSDQRCRAWRLDLQDGRSVAAQKHGHAAGLRPGRRDFQTPRRGRLAAGSAVRNRRCTK
jgi:hypothetical protein